MDNVFKINKLNQIVNKSHIKRKNNWNLGKEANLPNSTFIISLIYL
jgi:hypothetical protein